MKQLSIEDAKQIELEILDYIDTLCKKHNINYIINYGTLIGAVRHQGFIPWDDDIDMVISQKDFKRFCDYLKAHPHPNYVLQDNSTDPGFYKEWACLRDLRTENRSHENFNSENRRIHEAQKYRGLHIDIFLTKEI